MVNIYTYYGINDLPLYQVSSYIYIYITKCWSATCIRTSTRSDSCFLTSTCGLKMGRMPCCEKVGLNKGPWKTEEDEKLVAYVERHGPGNWRSVPAKAGN